MNSTRALGALTLALVIALAPNADAQRRRTHRPAAHAARVAPPPSTAEHVTIMDSITGTVLLCDDCNTPIPPASMSKLMTALIVAEALQHRQITWDTRYHVSENAWRHGASSDGSHMFLELNSDVSVRDLLQGLMIVSANDACIVLAEGLAGSEEAFVARMNQRAQELGLRTAHFDNATGLPDPNHMISSADLARLARFIIINHPEFYRIYGTRTFTYNNHTQENRNPILGVVEGADGMKTGHTDDSGYGLVGSAQRGNVRRIIVFNGTNSMAARRSEGIRLMNSAFEDYAMTQIAAAGQHMGEAQVRLGARATVPLVSQRPILIVGPRGMQSGLRARIAYTGPLAAPVRQGAVVAHLVVEGPGFQRQEYPLAAAQTVNKANWFVRFWEGLRLTLFRPS